MKNHTYNNEYSRLCTSITNSIDNNLNKTLSLISICGELQYQWNQVYYDAFLEESITKVSNKVGKCTYEPMENSILFYDSFGLDTRGLALIYLKALSDCGHKVIYLTIEDAKNKQPEIDKIIENTDVEKVYFSNTSDRLRALDDILKVFTLYRPKKIFFYALPNDSVGATAVRCLSGKMLRYQVNLTDHAFWLGADSIDYCIEFRSYGAAITNKYRNIKKERIILLPFYPNINKDVEFQGFGFETQGMDIMFSGGALYKTFDHELTYYSMVKQIMESNPNLLFVYAGSGDVSGINELRHEFGDRIQFISERKDLFSFMQNITIYLSTYPITGGLMTQYAAAAGKIPITLKFDSISDGFLIDQKKCQIEYDSIDGLVNDVSRLLRDKSYLKRRESLLKYSLSNSEIFKEELESILSTNSTNYDIDFTMPDVEKLQRNYRENFQIDKYGDAVARKTNLSCFMVIPGFYIKKTIKRIFSK